MQLILLFAMLAADDPKPSPTPSPKLSDVQVISFLKARAAYAEAQFNLQTTRDKLQSVFTDLAKTCNSQVTFADDVPVCVVAPTSPKPPTTK